MQKYLNIMFISFAIESIPCFAPSFLKTCFTLLHANVSASQSPTITVMLIPSSLPADVLWCSFVTHTDVRGGEMNA